MQKIYFISGVCGVGKSAIIPHLKNLLSHEKYDVRDFDERGVPDGADSEWRKSEIKKWLEIGTGSAERGVSTIICGFAKMVDFEGLTSGNTPEIEVVLLDADAETIRKRLTGRYTKDGLFNEDQKVIGKPVNKFIEDNVYYCDVMKKECQEDACKIVDTSHLDPEAVAEKVIELIQ